MAVLGFTKNKKQGAQAVAPVKKSTPSSRRVDLVLVKPVLSEKATMIKDTCNAYVFKISPRANKITVAREVEVLYKVHVTKVETVKVPPKPKKTGRFSGYRSGYRKAIVHIKPGEKIDLI